MNIRALKRESLDFDRHQVIDYKGYKRDILQKAFQEYVAKQYGEGFSITQVRPIHSRHVFELNILFQDGHQESIEVNPKHLLKELNLEGKGKLYFPAESTLSHSNLGHLKAALVGNFEDAFTQAATTYFHQEAKKEVKIPRKIKYLKPIPRLVVTEDKILLTKRGLSRIEQVFFRIFKPTLYSEWQNQNRHTIGAYLQFLVRECGQRKITQIEKRFGFNLDDMKEKGEPLLPIYIYYFNIGMNNIEMSDIEQFAKKLKNHLFNLDGSRPLSPLSLIKSNFTHREIRGLIRGNLLSIADLQKRFTDLTSIVKVDELNAKTFNDLVDVLMTPKEDWDKAYTGRKFSAPIKGAYNQEVGSTRKFRPWIDLQELAQTHWDVRDFSNELSADRFFYEYLVKIGVKKHLLRSSQDGEWNAGALLPSPYKDQEGKTVWYRVSEGVDSAYGKYWLVLEPANPNYDKKFPIIRINRDTCTNLYVQRAGPTISRDLAKDAGYKYSHTTDEEDHEFFDQFTLPVWMGYLGVATIKLNELLAANASDLTPLRNLFEKAYLELKKVQSKKNLSSLENALHSFKENPTIQLAQDYLSELYWHTDSSTDDYQRLIALITGQKHRSVSLIGTSLGGFDAQHDLVKETAKRGRVPVATLNLYTHSTLKIGEEDNQTFNDFISKHEKLLSALESQISIDHITQKDDPVSQFGEDRTFLGEGLPEDQVNFRVFQTLKTSTDPQITQIPIHIRRVEHLQEEKDLSYLSYTIAEYNRYSAQKRILRNSIDFWHGAGQKLGLSALFDRVWSVYRFITSPNHGMSREERSQKLVVKLEEHHFSKVNRRNSPKRIKKPSPSA